jgi:hypothetical protein
MDSRGRPRAAYFGGHHGAQRQRSVDAGACPVFSSPRSVAHRFHRDVISAQLTVVANDGTWRDPHLRLTRRAAHQYTNQGRFDTHA